MADSDRPLYKILSTKTIWWASALILAVAAAVTTWLLLAFGYQLEAIKTASTIVLGTGGAAALLLAARRQRSTELALNQKDRDLAHQERDAIERRITDLYTKAADQLGSDKAPVRLAGLYALERVAQNNPDLRQTIVNVWCAYLRMPYDPPADTTDPTHLERLQEREVRLTAQRLLTDHLRPGPDLWSNITLDLTGATLIDFTLSHCSVATVTFRSATFTGDADLQATTVAADANFTLAEFTQRATFAGTVFAGSASFKGASFADIADFSHVRFAGKAEFNRATFERDAWFSFAVFDDAAAFGEIYWMDPQPTFFKGLALFEGATFNGPANFDSSVFSSNATFASSWGDGSNGATFNFPASFSGTTFDGMTDFGSVQFRHDVSFVGACFNSSAAFDGTAFGGGPTTFGGAVSFAQVNFVQGVPDLLRPFWSPPPDFAPGASEDNT